jgi:4-amino-4-deoxy-L-arabinose transferase-like glycosyltransferase
MNVNTTSRYVFWILSLKVIASLLLLLYLGPALLPDEAQYWVWSRALDWGYYSKPAGIAYQIYIAVSLLGNQAWVVRLPSIFLAAGSSWWLYLTAKKIVKNSYISAAVSLLFAFSPMVLYGSFAATTDSGLLFGWCMILYALETQPSKSRNFWLIFASWLGVLFKPTIFILVLAQALRFDCPLRRRFHDASYLLIGCLLGSLGPLIWNFQHEWVTFKHMATQLGASTKDAATIDLGRPFLFLMTQALIVSPYLMYRGLKEVSLEIKNFFIHLNDRKFQHYNLWTWHALFVFIAIIFSLISCFKVKYQANWIVFIYPHLFLLIARFLQRNPDEKNIFKISLFHCSFHSIIFILVIFISWSQTHVNSPLSHTPFHWNAFRAAAGWQDLSYRLKKLELDLNDHFFISDKYQTVSQLAFYQPQTDVYWFNLHASRHNQFSFWPVEAKWKDKNAYFLAVENQTPEQFIASIDSYMNKLTPYFEIVESWQVIPFFEQNSRVEKSLLCIKLKGYKGNRPLDPQCY